ncbi:hypothetical protein E2562_033154 [Oryza meyeriana var. granulata]|uniref:Uncharacterized protein n=1 Tax=Oryza meyeriana var. granulata TaxID=110450 RepID=A0A6G1DRH5_9ORYZ|nr:hypothetical protein E2562_033154 [Oryza meyeriana var. granulata]
MAFSDTQRGGARGLGGQIGDAEWNGVQLRWLKRGSYIYRKLAIVGEGMGSDLVAKAMAYVAMDRRLVQA